jgi:dipeptidyl-peptidase-4
MKAPTEKLSVNRIYDYPNLSGDSISNINWSPDGRYLSYILGDRNGDKAEIRAYDVNNREGLTLFDFSSLSGSTAAASLPGQALDGLTPLHDWRSRRVQSAGPMQYQWFPTGQLLLVSVAGHAPQIVDFAQSRQVPMTNDKTPVRDAQVSPDGRFISFVRGWDLWLKGVAYGSREFPVTYASSEQFRSATGDSMGDLLVGFTHWWSPDSQAVAYIQTDESQVPIFWYANLTSKTGQNRPERYPQPGDPNPTIVLKVARGPRTIMIDTSKWPGYYIARVMWLPDARHIALQMLNREQDELQVVLADSYTGATRTVLVEKDPYWINVVDDWRFFSDSRRFLWSSERDSLRNLYIYDINGTQLAQLTDGAEACISVRGLDEKNGAVYYQVFPEPHTDAMLSRVDFATGPDGYDISAPETITTEPGSHFAHISPDFEYFGDFFSTAIRPPCLDLRNMAGERVHPIETNRTEELARYGLRDYTFQSHEPAQLGIPSDRMKVYSKLLEPARREKGKKYPVIVYVYGGPLPGGFGLARNVLNYWRPVPEMWLQMMAQSGFGVFTLDNRGSNAAARGHDFETPIHRQLGHVELADQLAGVEYLKTLDWVDPDRIGILGGSFGGFMTLNAMMRSDNAFRAGCAFAAVTDWREYDAVYTERYMQTPRSNPEGYEESSIRNYASQLENPLLLIHGGSDPNVHLQHTIELIEKFIIEGKEYGLLIYPNQVHMSFFGMGQSPARLWTRITKFFKEALT